MAMERENVRDFIMVKLSHGIFPTKRRVAIRKVMSGKLETKAFTSEDIVDDAFFEVVANVHNWMEQQYSSGLLSRNPNLVVSSTPKSISPSKHSAPLP